VHIKPSDGARRAGQSGWWRHGPAPQLAFPHELSGIIATCHPTAPRIYCHRRTALAPPSWGSPPSFRSVSFTIFSQCGTAQSEIPTAVYCTPWGGQRSRFPRSRYLRRPARTHTGHVSRN